MGIFYSFTVSREYSPKNITEPQLCLQILTLRLNKEKEKRKKKSTAQSTHHINV